MAILLKPKDHGRKPRRVEQIGGWGVLSGRGWTMYCDRCGNQLTLGGQYCTKCGKAILPGGAAPSAAATGQVAGSTGAYAGSTGTYGASSGAYGERVGMTAGAPARAAGAADGRVRRNIHRLATLWMINGILRLAWVGWMMLFGRFIPPMRVWMGPGGGPFWGWGLDGALSRGIFSAGIVLALFGVAWGLFEREPWARFLGLALGFLALLRFPLGTAGRKGV